MRGVIAAIKAYAHHPDWRVATANGVALLVASNQPFYPLYVWWLVGADAALVSLVTWFSTTFFLLVPHFSRYNATAGRVLLAATGAGNTFVCAWAFGVQSGVELFLVPCALLAVLPFHRREWKISLSLLAAGAALFVVLHNRYGALLVSLDAAQTASFLNLHIYSVVALAIYLVWSYAGTWSGKNDKEKRDHGAATP